MLKFLQIWTCYLAVKGPWQLSLDDHGNNAKHPADQRVVAQLFALPKQIPPLTQPIAYVLRLLLRFAGFCSDQVLTVGLAGVFSEDFGEGVLEDGTMEKLKRLLTWLKIGKTRTKSTLAAERSHCIPVENVARVQGFWKWRREFRGRHFWSAAVLGVCLQTEIDKWTKAMGGTNCAYSLGDDGSRKVNIPIDLMFFFFKSI